LLVAKGATKSKHPFKPHSDTAEPLLRYKTGGTWNPENEEQSIAPQSEYVHLATDQLSKEQYDATRAGKRFLMLIGDLQYCDELGNYTHRTFQLYYSAQFDTFFDMSETDWSGFYKFPVARSDQEYLPPCDQPEEREAREKQRRENFEKMAKTANVLVGTVSPSPKP